MYKEYLRPYKFYLSFENALCEDYITEKFFTTLMTEEAIPINKKGGKESRKGEGRQKYCMSKNS